MTALRRDHHRQRRRRRHAGHRLAPVGQAHPAARARRLAAARAAELVGGRRLRRQPLRLARHLVRRATASRSSRRSTTSSAARRSSTARRSTACARRTSASCATTTASRRPGRSPTTRSSPTTRRPSSSTRCTARAARIRPSRRRARPTRSRRSRTSRASSSSPTTSRPPGSTRSTRPAGSCSTRPNMPYSALRPLRDLRRLPVPRARQVGRRGARRAAGARAPERHAADQRAGACGWRPTRPARRSPTSSSSATASGRRYAADIVVVACGAANTAKLLLRSANDAHPNGLANGSDQVGRNYMFHNSQAVLALSHGGEPDGLPEDARAQRLLLRRPRTSTTRWATSRWSASPRPPMYRGEKPLRDQARARSGRSSEVARHAVDFWLSTEDLPRPDNRVTVDRDGSVQLTYKPTNQRAQGAPATTQLKSMLGHLGMHDAPPGPPPRLPQERDPGRRRAPTRPAPAASAPTRRPRCSTPTAARTSSTTSTSSTRASSRASARSTRR